MALEIGSVVTPDGGLMLVRELNARMGIGRLAAHRRLIGYEDLNDAGGLAQDPAFRLIGSNKVWDRGAVLRSRLHRFEAQMLAEECNVAGRAQLKRALIAKAKALDGRRRVVLDTDSTENSVYGEQEESVYSGHFEFTWYHALLFFNGDADCLASTRRPGNVHRADGWQELLLPLKSSGGRRWGSRLWSARMRRLPNRRVSMPWSSGTSGLQSISQPQPGKRHCRVAGATGGAPQAHAAHQLQRLSVSRRQLRDRTARGREGRTPTLPSCSPRLGSSAPTSPVRAGQ